MKTYLWRNIFAVETKLAKNIGLFYQAKSLLEEKSVESIYFASIYSYLNYVNIAWPSTYRTKPKIIHFHQKHAAHILFSEDKLTVPSSVVMIQCLINIYQINLYQHIAFMYKLYKSKASLTLNELIKKPFHKYLTKFSENCFSLKAISPTSTKYCISFWGPKIWNKFLRPQFVDTLFIIRLRPNLSMHCAVIISYYFLVQKIEVENLKKSNKVSLA